MVTGVLRYSMRLNAFLVNFIADHRRAYQQAEQRDTLASLNKLLQDDVSLNFQHVPSPLSNKLELSSQAGNFTGSLPLVLLSWEVHSIAGPGRLFRFMTLP